MVLSRWQGTIVDGSGNIQDGATVEVRREAPGAPLANLYSDRDGTTPIGNPITADIEGFVAFHAAGGAYRIAATRGSFSRTWRYVAIGTAGETDQEDFVGKDANNDVSDVRNFSQTGYHDMAVSSVPAAPPADTVRIFPYNDNGTLRYAYKNPNGNIIDLDRGIISAKDYHAANDGVRINSGCAIAASDNTLTAPASTFISADVGKAISIPGAGAAGMTLHTTIASLNSPSSVEVTDAASTTVSDGSITFGSDDAATLQDAFDAVESDGVLIIPPGIYHLGSSDLIIYGAGSGNSGAALIIGNGAEFIGTGSLIIDSSKRVSICGIDMPTMGLRLRGCWYSHFNQMRWRRQYFGDAAGTDFDDNYWDNYEACQFQAIITGNAGGASNAHWWRGCTLRGDATQGFEQTAATAIQLTGNVDTQQWAFFGGDISYHDEILDIDVGNSGSVDLVFQGVYFDDVTPIIPERDDTHIETVNCWTGDEFPYGTRLEVASKSSTEIHRNDRSTKFQSHGLVNLIPNGDFRRKMANYVGTGLPIPSANSAIITEQTGDGVFGRFLNINQALTSNNSVRFRCNSVPFSGAYTGTLLIRNAGSGAKTVRFGFMGLFFDVELSDIYWSLVTVTNNDTLASASQQDLLIFTNDGTTFNVDVGYAGLVFGEHPPLFVQSSDPEILEGSTTWNPPNIADGDQATTTVFVAGAELGDFVEVSFGVSLAGLSLTGYVSAADTVTVMLQNNSGGAIDLGSSTVRVRVHKFYG